MKFASDVLTLVLGYLEEISFSFASLAYVDRQWYQMVMQYLAKFDTLHLLSQPVYLYQLQNNVQFKMYNIFVCLLHY